MTDTKTRRFGLGTTLILASALFTFGGAAAAYGYEAPHNRAITALNDCGALVLSYSPRESQPLEGWLPYDRWLPHQSYSVHFGERMGFCGTGLCFSSGPSENSRALTDDDLVLLQSLPTAGSLSLTGQAISDEGLKHLRGHPGISSIDLSGTRVTAASIEALATLPKLRYVCLSKGAFSEAELARLREARSGLQVYLN